MKKLTPLLFLFVIQGIQLTAQDIDSALNALATRYPIEKVYVHYDKEYYVAGETIWFKAYLYSNGLPATFSNNFYLQLIEPDGKVINRKKYPVKGATIKGEIELPNSLQQGYYHIRALTPGMLDANQDAFYSKNIFVFNPADKTGNSFSAPQLPPLSVRFFPESGYLVDGISSAVVFKAVDSSGMPVEISGIIRMDDSVNLASFKTYHDGIGKVQIKPQYGKKYMAAIMYNGQTSFFPLPEVQSSGINLRVEDEKGGKMFLLSRSKKEKDNYDKLLLVARMNNMIVYETEINFESFFSVKGHLLTDSLPSGILHFTMFSKDGRPLAERLTFVNNGEYESNAGIEIVKKGIAPREENIFEINFPEGAQRSISVAVTDAEISPVIARENIITKLLLTDDLKGKIYNPAWYFQDRKDSTRQKALDNLMLIHGWSRFSWKEIFAGAFPERKQEDKYLITINGNIRDAKTNTAVSGGSLVVFMDAEDSVNQHFEVPVDASGRFAIDSLLFFGKARLNYAYKTAQGNEKTVNISFDQQPTDIAVERLSYTVVEAGNNSENNIPDFSEDLMFKRFRGSISPVTSTKELEPAVVKAKSSNKRPLDEVNESYTSGMFTSMGKMNFDNIHEPENDRSISVFDFIKRSVNHVIVEDDKFVNRKNFDLFDNTNKERFDQKKFTQDSGRATAGGDVMSDAAFLMGPMGHDPGKHFEVAIFLNESPAYVGILKTITMNEVALIKFYGPGFIGAGAAEGPGGALSIYTKKDISPPGSIDKLDQVVYNGYSLTKEFYSPDYSLPVQQKMQEDIRTTLYWNPEVYTDTQSKTIRLRFYNNDFSKKLKIVVEGFDASGRLIHVEKIIGN
ncbi:MAG TPA: hypothetical protein VK483_03895 [Chitinophagaceae bacterium]|nr:hypothetical protein [Chitinophagaceae bacterium]